MTSPDLTWLPPPRLDFPLDEDIASLVEAIHQGHAADPVALALQGVEVYIHLSHKPYLYRPLEVNAEIRGLCRALVRARPDCAPLVNLANDMLKPLPVHYDRREGERMRTDMRARAEQWREELLWRESHRPLRAARLIQDGARLLCHGYSHEIVGVLRQAWSTGARFSVTCVAGLPRSDGQTLADELGHYSIAAEVVSDAAAPAGVAQATRILSGTHAIHEDGLVQRPGMLALAQAAQTANVPLTILCGPEKFFPAGYWPYLKQWSEAQPGGPFGPDWEITPLDYVSSVVTGDATLSGPEVRAVLAKRQVESLLLG
jgi:translation initiation factor 2B subunit (eIF-2B alpha/beta/delta family)